MAVNYTPFIQQALQIQKQGLDQANNRFYRGIDAIGQLGDTLKQYGDAKSNREAREQKAKFDAEDRKFKNQDRLRNQRIQDAALIKNNFESEMDLDMKTLDRFPPGSPAYDRALEAIKKKQRGFNENYQNYLMKGGDVESLVGGNKQKNPFEPGSSFYEGMEKHLAKQAGKAGLKPKTAEQQKLEEQRPVLYETIKNLNKEIADTDFQYNEAQAQGAMAGGALKEMQEDQEGVNRDLRRVAGSITGRMDHKEKGNPLMRLQSKVTEESIARFEAGENPMDPNDPKEGAWQQLHALQYNDMALADTIINGITEDDEANEKLISSIPGGKIPDKQALIEYLKNPDVKNLLISKTRDYSAEKESIETKQGVVEGYDEMISKKEGFISDMTSRMRDLNEQKKTKEDARQLAIQTSRKVDAGIKDLQSARNYDYYNTSLGFGYDASEVGASAENLAKRINLGHTTEKDRLTRVYNEKIKTISDPKEKTLLTQQFNENLTALDNWKKEQLPLAQQGMQITAAPTFDSFALNADDAENAVSTDLRARGMGTIEEAIREASSPEDFAAVRELINQPQFNENDRKIFQTLIDSEEGKEIEVRRQASVAADMKIASTGFNSHEEYLEFVQGINDKGPAGFDGPGDLDLDKPGGGPYTDDEVKKIKAEAKASWALDRLGTRQKDSNAAELIFTEASEGASNPSASPESRSQAASLITPGLIKRMNPGLSDEEAAQIATSTKLGITSGNAQKRADAIATLGGGNAAGRDETGKPHWVATIENLKELSPDQKAIAIKKARDNRYKMNKENANELLKALSNHNLSQATRSKAQAGLYQLYQDDKISFDDWKQANFNAEMTSELGQQAEAKEILDTKVKHNLPLTDKEISSAFQGKPKLAKVWKKGYEGQMAKTHLLNAVSRGDRSAVEKWAKDNPDLIKQVEQQYGITLTGPGNILDESDTANMKDRLAQQKMGKEMLHGSIKHLIDPSTGKFRSDKGLEDVLKDNNIDLEDLMKNIGLSTLGTVKTADQAKAYLEAIYSPKPLTSKQEEDQTFSRIRAAKTYYGIRWDMMKPDKRIDALNHFMTGILPSMKMSENIQPTKFNDDISEQEVRSQLEEQTGVKMPPILTEEEIAAAPNLAPGQFLGSKDPSIP